MLQASLRRARVPRRHDRRAPYASPCRRGDGRTRYVRSVQGLTLLTPNFQPPTPKEIGIDDVEADLQVGLRLGSWKLEVGSWVLGVLSKGGIARKWYIDAVKTTIDKAGRVVIPAAVRERAGLSPGSEIEITEDELGIRLERTA